MSSISNDLKRTFGIATLRREAAKILNASEWKELQGIKKKFLNQAKFEKRAHELEYDTRVEVMRKRLSNQAGSKTRDFKRRWFGNDRFDKAAIDRQAHRLVRNQLHQSLGRLEIQETRAINALMDRSEHRQHLREKPKQDFNKKADRRQGERRQSRTISRSR